MNTHDTNPVPETNFGNITEPQFYCAHCREWKTEITRLPTKCMGHFICADCEDKRGMPRMPIDRKGSEIHRWHEHAVWQRGKELLRDQHE